MKPPIEYLLVCSGISLRDFELNRLNAAANLRKQIIKMEDDLRQAMAEAELARWLMEHREVLLSAGAPTVFQASFEFPKQIEERELFPALPAGRPLPARSSREAKAKGAKSEENVA
jgi:hypothetical protein